MGKISRLLCNCGETIQYLNGFDVRFSYDETKIQPSNIQTNVITDDELEYFQFAEEFQDSLDIFTIPFDGEGAGIRAIVSINPPISEKTEHIVERDGKISIDTKGSVLLGTMSFQMTEETYDPSWFQLVTSTSSPKTGIKISVSTTEYYEAQSTFRFTGAVNSKEAKLSDLIVSTGTINEENPEYMMVAFDKGKTFGHEKYKGYKDGRKETPDELKKQFPVAKEIVKAMGIPCFEIDNYEADDIIGTFANEIDKEDDYYSVIVIWNRYIRKCDTRL